MPESLTTPLLAAGRDTCAGRRTWPAAFGAGLTAVLAVPVPASPNRQRRAARTQPDEAAIRGRIAPHATGLRRTAASARNPPESRREPPAGDSTPPRGCAGPNPAERPPRATRRRRQRQRQRQRRHRLRR